MSHAAGIQSQVFHVGRAVLSLEYAHIHLGLRLDLEAEMVEVFPTHLYACLRAKSLQSCPTLCDPMTCSLPGSSVHGILQESWSGLPCPSPEDLPDPGIEPASPVPPALQVGSLPLQPPGKPFQRFPSVCSLHSTVSSHGALFLSDEV